MSLIKLSFQKKHIILLYCLGLHILYAIARITKNVFRKKEDFNIDSLYFMGHIGNSFLIFLYLIEKKRSKKKTNVKKKTDIILYLNDEEDKERNKKVYVKNKIKKSYLNEKKISILIVCVIFLKVILVLFEYPFFYYYINLGEIDIIKFEVISLMLMSFIIKTNKKVYSHQLFSFILVIISLSLDFILNKKVKIFFIILSSICKTIPYAITLNIYKYLNESQFVNIYLLGCLNGLIHIINIIIIEYIRKFFNIEFYYLIELPLKNKGFIITSILNILSGFFYNYMMFSIIQTLDPIHISIIDLILDESINDLNLITSVSLIFTIIGILIFLEILILNFCGLGRNVKENILNRAIEENIEIDISSNIGSIIPTEFTNKNILE